MLTKTYTLTAIIFASIIHLHAYEQHIGVAHETNLAQKKKTKHHAGQNKKYNQNKERYKNYSAFTGKILGNGVRLRLNPDVSSPIAVETEKNDYIVVTGDETDFYAVEAPSNMKVYIFRSFVLDNIVEGNKVNLRLHPDLTSPVVGFMSSGDQINGGVISEKNHKWLEFTPPKNVYFYVAKEFVEKVGGREMKEMQDQKLANLSRLIESTSLLSQTEIDKPYKEIDMQKILLSHNEIISDYAEFQKEITPVKLSLAKIKEQYLQIKLSYLEKRALAMEKISNGGNLDIALSDLNETNTKSRMKIWEKVEEGLFKTWASQHHKKTMEEYYQQQKFSGKKMSGIVEVFDDPIRNRPGSYILRDRDTTIGYVYSTMVNLDNYVGQYVTLVTSERHNNNFAYPAYYALEAE